MIQLSDVNPGIPEEFTLESVYPNPFNPSTTIDFGISVSSDVNISIYNIQGQRVETLHNGFMDAGYYSESWNASSHPSGIYVVRMSTSTGFNSTQKIVLIK